MDYELEELRRIQEESERSISAALDRVSQVEADAEERSFSAVSDDGLASVRVSSTGAVLDITLARGFGDMNRPTWMAADDIDKVARSIVEAVRRARSDAGADTHRRFAEAFPGAYELLDDLRPAGAPGSMERGR
ncbi:YbaB/EbfC family nucleoid-associated protein [Nocardia sp. 004]|uniref:YbaB/EbfC family nucleoid-associated protein n=1 Tax=Nocardia sp. 004 TaxID=3385978 RepID=UPI0039A07E86